MFEVRRATGLRHAGWRLPKVSATLGYVVDFIDVYYGMKHWPAFNIADSAITFGAVMLIIDLLFMQRHSKG